MVPPCAGDVFRPMPLLKLGEEEEEEVEAGLLDSHPYAPPLQWVGPEGLVGWWGWGRLGA